jgi:signal transduction histidine kinase
MRGTGDAPEALHARRFAELNGRLVRLVANAASAAVVALGVSGFVTSETDFLIQAGAAGLVACVAWLQVLMRREDAGVLLSITTAAIIVTTTIIGTSSRAGASSTALAIIGMVGSLFIGAGIRFYVAGYAVLLIAANFAWYDGIESATVGALIAATSFTFGVLVFVWLRSQLQDEASRFRHLFANAPVSIWEEDFTDVGAWLDELRAEGVVDLIDYLDNNPEALAHAAGLIEIHAVNDAAVELVEAEDQSQLVGRLHAETWTPQALQSMVPQLMAVWSSIDHLVLQVRDGRTLRGNRIEGLLSWTAPMTSEGLDLSRVIVAIVDVTGIRSAAEDLELLVKSRDELVATVSHELRTPLTTVVGLSHELRDAFNTFEREEVVDLVGLIAQQSTEVATIVEDLLVAARTRGGSLGVSATPVDLAFEVEATLKSMALDPDKMLTCPQYLPAVNGDSGRIRQILRNLITNAQRYGGKEIRVVVRSGESIAAVEVRDSGPPLAEDESEEIFSRYYRNRQTPGVTASVGLGLTVSQELARLMGGDITYHHDGEAVFTVRLPVAERTPSHAR